MCVCGTEMLFVANQLSPSLIDLSPLTKHHPMLLQQQRVRSLKRMYLLLICAWLDHLVSGISEATEYTISESMLPELVTLPKLLVHYTRGTQSRLNT